MAKPQTNMHPHSRTHNYRYYTSKFVGADDNTPLGFFVSDVDRAGRPIGERAAGDWQSVAPEGLLKLLRHIDARYARPEIVVTGEPRGDML